jgi:hypothetical protein
MRHPTVTQSGRTGCARWSGFCRTRISSSCAAKRRRWGTREHALLVHPEDYVHLVEQTESDRRAGGARPRHLDDGLQPGSGLPGGGGRRARRRCGDQPGGQQRVLRRAPAGPPCRTEPRDGLLPVRLGGDCRQLCPRGLRPGPGGGGGLSTCTTATARKTSSGRTRICSLARPTRCRCFPARARCRRPGEGNIFNAPLSAGDGGDVFRDAMLSRIFPALDAFEPDLILISAGFDAHQRDPLGSLQLTEEDFAWVTLRLMDLADKALRRPHCVDAGGRL